MSCPPETSPGLILGSLRLYLPTCSKPPLNSPILCNHLITNRMEDFKASATHIKRISKASSPKITMFFR